MQFVVIDPLRCKRALILYFREAVPAAAAAQRDNSDDSLDYRKLHDWEHLLVFRRECRQHIHQHLRRLSNQHHERGDAGFAAGGRSHKLRGRPHQHPLHRLPRNMHGGLRPRDQRRQAQRLLV